MKALLKPRLKCSKLLGGSKVLGGLIKNQNKIFISLLLLQFGVP